MSNTSSIIIQKSNIDTVVKLSKQIPEFINPSGAPVYEERLKDKSYLILVAFVDKKPAGFKVGYQKEDYFYSWMGGVLPEFRRLKLAKQLADTQESWAKKQGFSKIIFKTRNQHKAMLIFALKNDFHIIGFKEKESIETNRILLAKTL